MDTPIPDETLVVALQDGDDAAFDELLARYKRPVINFIYRMLNDAASAEDVAQEVFVKVYRNIHRFKPGKDRRFSTWLFQIARNQTLDTIRHRRRRPLEFNDWSAEENAIITATQPAPDVCLVREEQRAAVARAIQQLPEKQRTALLLTVYHELSQAEIAAVMGCTARAVESHLARARKQLRTNPVISTWIDKND